ncbi:MAG: aspartate aminotransferase family protein [Myxococcales bacterium]|nr:aspartate aminotransferase family protein [Myxococcales bacterium]
MTSTEAYAACYRHSGEPFVRGEGCYLVDQAGSRFLDLGAGVAVSSLGHGHPALISAIAQQAQDLIHTSNLYETPSKREIVAKLASLTGLERVFLSNSGAEANEAAIKLARRTFQVVRNEDRHQIIAADHSFHGRTMGALSATGQPKYWKGFEPLLPGFSFVPYGDTEALRNATNEKTAAILLEPIQGEGGVIVPSDDYLKAAREIANDAGALLIFDEIQTGVSRTGRFLACQHAGVVPDALTLAKGIAGGLPLGALVYGEHLAEALVPGTHASTFGGNPVACAAANVVVDTVSTPDFMAHVQSLGEQIIQELTTRLAGLPHVQEVRGRGLLLGVVLTEPAKPFVTELFNRGVLTTVAGGNVLRLSPPLVITKEELKTGLDEIVDVLTGWHA